MKVKPENNNSDDEEEVDEEIEERKQRLKFENYIEIKNEGFY